MAHHFVNESALEVLPSSGVKRLWGAAGLKKCDGRVILPRPEETADVSDGNPSQSWRNVDGWICCEEEFIVFTAVQG